jgi:hypothetical protein
MTGSASPGPLPTRGGRSELNVQSRLGASDVTTEASTDTKLTDTKLTDTELKSTDTKLKLVIAEQEEIFVRRQPTSARLAIEAAQHLTGGVTSSWQITVPQPVWLSHGRGSKIWDVDGTIMLARSFVLAIIGYLGYRFLTRGERGSRLDALTTIAGSEG